VAGGELHSKAKQFGEDRPDALGYFIYVWDYENKHIVEHPELDGDDALKKFVSVPLCIEYSPDGLFLVCSFLNGRLLFLDA